MTVLSEVCLPVDREEFDGNGVYMCLNMCDSCQEILESALFVGFAGKNLPLLAI